MFKVKIDFHGHTTFSDGTLTPEEVIRVAKRKGLDGVAITDHNTIEGAVLALENNDDEDFIVIIGSEISTNRGHILGLFLTKEVKQRSFFDVIEEIHAQGGIAVAAHPYKAPLFYPLRGKRRLVELNEKEIGLLDGLESLDGRAKSKSNLKAEVIATFFKKVKLAGSDYHFGFEIGSVYTEVETESKSLDFLKKSLSEGRTCVKAGLFRNIGYLVYLLDNFRKKRFMPQY